jgi:hypothetical protein
MTSQQQALLRIMPLFTGVWSFVFPAGLVLYWATSNSFRIGQQAYITRSLYSHEDSPGRKAMEVTGRAVEPERSEELRTRSGPGKQNAKDAEATARSGSRRSERSGTDGQSEPRRAPTSQRSERWAKERAATSSSAPPKQRATASGRVTPKGSAGTPRKKKRKR